MSTGDVISNIAVVGAGVNLDFQPAAGVEALIFGVSGDIFTGITPNRTLDLSVHLRNAAIDAALAIQDQQPAYHIDMRLYINNIRYLRITNTAIAVQSIGYYGLQTK